MLLIWVLRGFFILLMMAVGLFTVRQAEAGAYGWEVFIAAIGVALVVVSVDVVVARKSLAALSGAFLGLIVGLVFSFGLALIVDLLVEAFESELSGSEVVVALKLIIGISCCYATMSLVLQTKDDFRFVIPYVEFARETRGARPLILDTSVIIDGRIAEICETGIIDAPILIPRFVLQELQVVADSTERLKRTRGRRGLDMLNKLQTNETVEIRISDTRLPDAEDESGVDEKLLAMARKLDGRVVTNDFNLNKIATLRGITVINLNDLSNALKPVVLPGESLRVRIIKPGDEAGQGVGYLEDGTMVVAEQSRDHLNEEVELTITSVLQTSAGRMVFGRPAGSEPAPRRKRPS